MNRSKTAVAVVGLALVASVGAQAQVEPVIGPYIGAELGGVREGADTTRLPGWNDTANAFFGGGVVGYRVTPNLSMELLARYYGDAEYKGSLVVEGRTLNAKVDVSGWSTSLSAVVYLPVGERSELYTKVGVYHWDLEAEASAAGVSVTADGDGNDFTLGFGWDYAMNDTTSVGVGYDWLNDFGAEDAHLVSLRVRYAID